MVSRLVLITVLLVLGACGAPVQRPPVDAPAPPADAPAPPPATTPEPPQQEPDGSGAAVRGLLESAREARLKGSFSRAETILQRAQRIAPRDAGVYLEYARLYLSQDEIDRAAAMAERGLLYCQGSSCSELRSLAR